MSIESIAAIVGIIVGVFTVVQGIREWRGKSKKAENKPHPQPEQIGNSAPVYQKLSSQENTEDAPEVDPVVKSFRELIQGGEYDRAKHQAIIERKELVEKLGSGDPDVQLDIADFDVWHARTLIYTGETEAALKKLDDVISVLENVEDDSYRKVRRNLILGRAHNDKGYAHWMNLGHYGVAKQEFSTAIRYFTTQKKQGDELATSCDNLGRVYAQLGNRSRAEFLIEYGRSIRANWIERGYRDGQKKNDRYALSLISSAITKLAFGDAHHALELSNEALKSLSPGNKRGQGLAYIVKGQAERYIGSLWHYKKPEEQANYQAKLNESLDSFDKAQVIFEKHVVEPIRRFQVHNEKGCALRELSLYQAENGNLDEALKSAENAKKSLEESMTIARENKYDVAFIDSCEDLARLYKHYYDEIDSSRDKIWLKDAQTILDEAEKIIERVSPNYFIKKNRLISEVKTEHCVEDFWQHLGKMHALRGHIIFDPENHLSHFARKDARKVLYRSMENYALAMGYFGRFLQVTRGQGDHNKNNSSVYLALMNHRLFSEQLYFRLRDLNTETISDITTNIIPKIKQEYHLADEWIDGYYDEIADLMMQIKPKT